MKLSQLDSAAGLRKQRREAEHLADMAFSSIITCKLNSTDVFHVLALDPIRKAIQTEANRIASQCEQALKDMGVEIDE